jgi:hypothetical protein
MVSRLHLASLRRLVLVVASAVALTTGATGCFGSACPAPAAMPCLTKKICTTDAKGCQQCTCEAAPNRRPEQDQPGQRLSP